MPINTAWRVEIGTVASPNNLTSRVMGMSISQSVDVNVMGRGQATITLRNQDGELTPGGGGSLGNIDWFAQGVFISALTDIGGAPTISPVFHGVVVDFDLVDNGVYSTVTLSCADGMTVSGQTTPTNYSWISSTYSFVIGTYIFGAANFYLPKLGNATSIGNATYEWAAASYGVVRAGPANDIRTYADVLQSFVIPTVNDVLWPTTIENASGTTRYNIRSLGPYTTRQTSDQRTFEFVPSASVTGSKLPFDDDGFTQAFNNDTLITQAEVGSFGGTSVTATAGTTGTYGSRAVQFLTTYNYVDKLIETSDRLANRYSTSRFNPTSIRISASMVKARCSNSAASNWADLLSIVQGIWQRTVITWTGSGADSQTAESVVKGRRIDVTPQDTVVTLTLGNWADNHGFILDTDQLDVDRLG